MVKIKEKKTKKPTREVNEPVENMYEETEEIENVYVWKEWEKLGKAIDMVYRVRDNNLNTNGRSMLTVEEVIAILNDVL